MTDYYKLSRSAQQIDDTLTNALTKTEQSLTAEEKDQVKANLGLDVDKAYVDFEISATVDLINDRVQTVEGNIPTKVSDLINDSGFLTEQDLTDTDGAITVSKAAKDEDGNNIKDTYAKKTDIPDISGKADKVHSHPEYLTEHQDLSSYAKKTDIPNVSGFISKIPDEYVTEDELTNGTVVPKEATKASQDGDGNVIKNTYGHSLTRDSDGGITLRDKDNNSLSTITPRINGSSITFASGLSGYGYVTETLVLIDAQTQVIQYTLSLYVKSITAKAGESDIFIGAMNGTSPGNGIVCVGGRRGSNTNDYTLEIFNVNASGQIYWMSPTTDESGSLFLSCTFYKNTSH